MKRLLFILLLLLSFFAKGQVPSPPHNTLVRSNITICGDSAIWAWQNPVLNCGETGRETNTGKQKIGDGVNHWNNLSYSTGITPFNFYRKLGVDSLFITINGVLYAVKDSAGTSSSASVDTIYRTPGKDSIQFKIAGRYHAILDSAGSSTGGTVTSVATSWGLTGGTIITTGTLKADSSQVTSVYANSLKLNKADSSAGGYYPYSSNPKGYSTGSQPAPIPNDSLAHAKVTILASTGLTGGGDAVLGGGVTLKVDTTSILTKADSTNGGYYPYSSNPLGYLISSSITGYVPYTGATNDLTLGLHSLSVDSPTFEVYNPSHYIGFGIAIPTHFVHTLLPTTSNFYIDARTNPRTLGSGAFRIDYTSAQSGGRAINLDVNASGYSDVHGFNIDYTTGTLPSLLFDDVNEVNIDGTSATGAELNAFAVNLTAAGSLSNVNALHVGAGVDPIHQLTGTFATSDKSWAFNSLSSAYTDITTGTNQIFVHNSDIVYVGKTASGFSEIDFILSINSNTSVLETFQYWNGSAWTTFYPSDGTNGFQHSGNITFMSTALTGWASTSVNGTSAYYIRMTRTKPSVLTLPTEISIQITVGSFFGWSKTGDITANSLTVINAIDTAYTNAVSAIEAGIDITTTTGGHKVTVNADTTTGVTKLATQGYVTRQGYGTVTSVATGLGLSGGTITTSGTLLVDTASASILSRQRAANTYAPISITGTVTSVATGNGLTGGTITTTGTLSTDTSGGNTKTTTHYQLNNTDSVGTLVNGIWNASTIDTAYGGTGATTTLNARDNLGTHTISDVLSFNGSQIKSYPIGLPPNNLTTSGALANQTVFCVMIEGMKVGTVITGAIWYQATVGSYTANNVNAIYLDSISNGTAIAVDSTANTAALWQTGSNNTWRTQAFASTYTTKANTSYCLRFIYCRSAEVTAPTIGLGPARVNAGIQVLDMTNSTKVYSTVAGQTSIGHTQAFSGLTSSAAYAFMGIY